MKKHLLGWVTICVLIVLSIVGCATPEKLEGRKVLDLLQQTVDEVGKKIESGVVFLEVTTGGRVYGLNGIALDNKGLILVPFAMPKNKKQEVLPIDNISVWIDRKEYAGTLIQSDDRVQLGIVQLAMEDKNVTQTFNVTPIKFGDINTLKPGQWLVSLQTTGKLQNYQNFIDLSMAGGKFLGDNFEELLLRLSTARIGGVPVVNLNGEMLGLIKADNRVISVKEVKKITDKLLAKINKPKDTAENTANKGKQPWVGFTYGIINEVYAEATKQPKDSIQIQRVYADSPADKAGLKKDDLILEVDEQPIGETGQKALGKFVSLLEPEIGRVIQFKIMRDGQTQNVKLTFEGRPEPKEFIAEDIGIKVQDIRDIEYYDRTLFVKNGVLVTAVTPGSPAATGGSSGQPLISPGSVLVELNKQPINSVDEFIKVVNEIRRQKQTVVFVQYYLGTYGSHGALNLNIGQTERGEKQ
jgi:serine protease Do